MTTKVAVIGANGNIGSAVVHDLSSRGKYEVYGIARTPSKVDYSLPNVKIIEGDASKPETFVPEIKGIEVLVSAIYFDIPPADIIKIAQDAGAKRVIIVGGAASLLVSEGGPRLIDTPDFPDEYRELANTGVKFYDELTPITYYDWTFFSPPIEIGPGPKTGKFRIGGDVLLTDKNGDSKISYDDYAIALVDELENGKFIKKRFTAAY